MATIKVDAVDMIVDKLNELDGIEFTRDAWENAAPDQYGVVEVNGQIGSTYGDGNLLDERWQITITAYVNGDDDGWPYRIREKLEELEAELDTSLTTSGREYAYDINKVVWRWTLRLWGPLTWEAEGNG